MRDSLTDKKFDRGLVVMATTKEEVRGRNFSYEWIN